MMEHERSDRWRMRIVVVCCLLALLMGGVAAVLWVSDTNDSQNVTLTQLQSQSAVICLRQDRVLQILDKIAHASSGVHTRAPEIPAEIIQLQGEPCEISIKSGG